VSRRRRRWSTGRIQWERYFTRNPCYYCFIRRTFFKPLGDEWIIIFFCYIIIKFASVLYSIFK
jgi:hypothetical protein